MNTMPAICIRCDGMPQRRALSPVHAIILHRAVSISPYTGLGSCVISAMRAPCNTLGRGMPGMIIHYGCRHAGAVF